jgi:hypothetical protein
MRPVAEHVAVEFNCERQARLVGVNSVLPTIRLRLGSRAREKGPAFTQRQIVSAGEADAVVLVLTGVRIAKISASIAEGCRRKARTAILLAPRRPK